MPRTNEHDQTGFHASAEISDDRQEELHGMLPKIDSHKWYHRPAGVIAVTAAFLATEGIQAGVDKGLERIGAYDGPTVSAEAVHETERLLELPDPYAVQQARDVAKGRVDWRAGQLISQASAEAEGLHWTSPELYLEPLIEDAQQGFKKPFSTYLEQARAYFATDDIEVSDTIPAGFFNLGIETVKDPSAVLETPVAKQNVIDLIQFGSRMTEEYAAMAKTERFILYPGAHDGIAAKWVDGAVFYNMSVSGSGGSVNHEVFHGAQYALGDRDVAAGLTRFGILAQQTDPEIQQYTQRPDGTSDLERSKRRDSLQRDKNFKELQGDHEDAAVTQRALEVVERDKVLVDATSPYGRQNFTEGSSELGQFFVAPDAGDWILDPDRPLLRAQSLAWLTRLREKSPRLFNYVKHVLGTASKNGSTG